ncbi:MAG: FHA domain-containing protein [Deltaproteobacteria bacterium]|nr:FHA domain-containing protein [Deltaproteobacteria bacterium]MCB9786048.1 FHA domain-containing protein [Deltaproteobacteria bacterium]
MNCSACGHPVAPDHRFCGNCGSPMQPVAPTRAAESVYHDGAPTVRRARLRLIRGDGGDGFTFQLNGTSHAAGRAEGPILFPDDPTVSPLHATFYYRDGRLFVRDEGSLNGTYIRIHEPVPITDGEIFLCGEQVLRFELYRPTPVVVGDDGAVFCGTPVAVWRFRVVQLVRGSQEGLVYCARKRTVTIGREDCDVNFGYDRFISHYHARIEERDGEYLLKDLDSRNGSYFRLKQEVPLSNGDYVFIGRQLLRVEFI